MSQKNIDNGKISESNLPTNTKKTLGHKKRIKDLIKSNPEGMTTKELAKKANLDRRSIHKLVNEMNAEAGKNKEKKF